MTDLLKAEFYKLAHSRSFWGITLFSLLLGSVLLLDSMGITYGLLNASLFNTPLLYFLVIVFAALFAGSDFADRTLYCFVSAGHKRGAVLFAKTFVYQTAVLLILTIPLAVHGLLGAFMDTGVGIPIVQCLTETAVIIAAILAMGMMPIACAFIFRDIGRTLAIPIVLYFIMIFELNGDSARKIAAVLPMGQLRLLSLNELPVSKLVLFSIDVLWITLLYAAAYISFRHSDLK